MKKIPTLFTRGRDDRRFVTVEVTPGCEWVIAGEGIATRKYDGICVSLDEAGAWWARREVKPGKTPPPHWVAVDDEPTTGKRQGWEPIAQSGFHKALAEALRGEPIETPEDEPVSYELCGPKVNGNPEGFDTHRLIRHDDAEVIDLPGGVAEIRNGMQAIAARGWEGVVWHHPDGRMAKLKIRDLPEARYWPKPGRAMSRRALDDLARVADEHAESLFGDLLPVMRTLEVGSLRELLSLLVENDDQDSRAGRALLALTYAILDADDELRDDPDAGQVYRFGGVQYVAHEAAGAILEAFEELEHPGSLRDHTSRLLAAWASPPLKGRDAYSKASQLDRLGSGGWCR